MAKPKHQRCTVCNVVTSRYSHTNVQGPFTFKVWVRDERNGSVQGADGKPYCRAHVEAAESSRPAPTLTESVDDDTFTVLSRALRGVDPVEGDEGL